MLQGAILTAILDLKTDEVLHIAIGQKGDEYSGSGGTFVIRECANGSFEPIVISGGAGGDYYKKANEWCNAQLNEFGNGSKSGEINNNIGGSGTTGGAGYKTDAPKFSKGNCPKCFQGGLQGGNYDTR